MYQPANLSRVISCQGSATPPLCELSHVAKKLSVVHAVSFLFYILWVCLYVFVLTRQEEGQNNVPKFEFQCTVFSQESAENRFLLRVSECHDNLKGGRGIAIKTVAKLDHQCVTNFWIYPPCLIKCKAHIHIEIRLHLERRRLTGGGQELVTMCFSKKANRISLTGELWQMARALLFSCTLFKNILNWLKYVGFLHLKVIDIPRDKYSDIVEWWQMGIGKKDLGKLYIIVQMKHYDASLLLDVLLKRKKKRPNEKAPFSPTLTSVCPSHLQWVNLNRSSPPCRGLAKWRATRLRRRQLLEAGKKKKKRSNRGNERLNLLRSSTQATHPTLNQWNTDCNVREATLSPKEHLLI